MKIIELTCHQCSNKYTLQQKNYDAKIKKGTKNFFCSAECFSTFRRKDMFEFVECKLCESKFKKRRTEIKRSSNHFCTTSCAATYNNQNTSAKNPAKPRICNKCEIQFTVTNGHTSYILCQSCCEARSEKRKSYMAKTLSEYHNLDSIKGKHPSWINAHIRGLNRSWNKALTEISCQVCNYSKHVELAHIKAISNFSLDSTLGEINSPDNILVLCRNCHWEFDNDLLDLSQIPPRI